MADIAAIAHVSTRAELLAADPRRETVTGLALRWGFSSPSRFSPLYRRPYGAVPIKTLHQG